MRFPHVINTNTREAYAPSDTSLELLKERDRKVFPEELTWGDGHCPSLVAFCVLAMSKNFAKKPIFHELPGAEKDLLLEILPTDLPLELVVPLIDNEIYWKRRYRARFGVILERLYPNWKWKDLFIERNTRVVIEQAQPQYGDEHNMSEITKLCCPYVHRLLITELQAWKPPLTMQPEDIPEVIPIDHVDFGPILKELHEIEELDVVFGMRNVKVSFNWNMWKLSVLDAKRLGEACLYLDNLRIVRVHRTKLSDSHCQALLQGLIKTKNLFELDLSHCEIGDEGALCVAKVMMEHPTLAKIKLNNNKIRTIGGQGLGFALLHNSCCPLIHLDLKLNPLEHDGTMGILRALVRGDKPQELSLAGCLFGEITPIRVAQTINLNRSLEVLDISSNFFGAEGGEAIVRALLNNRVLKWLDLRETDIPQSYLRVIKKILIRNRRNEEELLEEEEVEEIEDFVGADSKITDESTVTKEEDEEGKKTETTE